MYPNPISMYNTNPYNQEIHVYSTPFPEDYYYQMNPYERQFGQFFPPMGPPSGAPGFSPPFAPPGQGPGAGPPFAPPGQGPGAGPPTAPPGQVPQVGPPSSPPPSFVPTQTQQQAEAFAVDPGGIRRCLFRYTYIWLRGFEQFWFYPIFVGRNSVAGYRWTGFRWMYSGISLRQIQSFTCV